MYINIYINIYLLFYNTFYIKTLKVEFNFTAINVLLL